MNTYTSHYGPRDFISPLLVVRSGRERGKRKMYVMAASGRIQYDYQQINTRTHVLFRVAS